jgi:hypothetical protein
MVDPSRLFKSPDDVTPKILETGKPVFVLMPGELRAMDSAQSAGNGYSVKLRDEKLEVFKKLLVISAVSNVSK